MRSRAATRARSPAQPQGWSIILPARLLPLGLPALGQDVTVPLGTIGTVGLEIGAGDGDKPAGVNGQIDAVTGSNSQQAQIRGVLAVGRIVGFESEHGVAHVRLDPRTICAATIAGELRNGEGGQDADDGDDDEQFDQGKACVVLVKCLRHRILLRL